MMKRWQTENPTTMKAALKRRTPNASRHSMRLENREAFGVRLVYPSSVAALRRVDRRFRAATQLFVGLLSVWLLAGDIFAADLQQLRSQAESGDVQSQFILGQMFYEGRTVAKDYKQAEKWL